MFLHDFLKAGGLNPDQPLRVD
jgi:ubiquitin C-terminal hydrolase